MLEVEKHLMDRLIEAKAPMSGREPHVDVALARFYCRGLGPGRRGEARGTLRRGDAPAPELAPEEPAPAVLVPPARGVLLPARGEAKEPPETDDRGLAAPAPLAPLRGETDAC